MLEESVSSSPRRLVLLALRVTVAPLQSPDWTRCADTLLSRSGSGSNGAVEVLSSVLTFV